MTELVRQTSVYSIFDRVEMHNGPRFPPRDIAAIDACVTSVAPAVLARARTK